ncbi:MAG: MerR family transcriptional regulator [Candidatus Kapabacteria bacterium]|nr:MerR family transcriptional regulator [Candidatus Kapabacteria bacterium]MDW8011894.1 MerR family transcriptional regulator [Bacteroidota bacterium]
MERYYRIGEVARLLGEQPHTLRHWERSFRQPRPRRGPMGERLYSEADIAVLRRIQHLLRVERYTLPQALRIVAEQPIELTGRSHSPFPREVLLTLHATLALFLRLLQRGAVGG